MERIDNPLERFKAQLARDQLIPPVSESQVVNRDNCPRCCRESDCVECEDSTRMVDGKKIMFNTAACKATQKRLRMLAKSGLFGKDITETFEAAKIDRHNQVLYDYLQKEWDRKQWLYIYNHDNGTGKSYTGNAIANMLANEGIQSLVIREVDMAAQIQETFSDKTGKNEFDLMSKWKNVPVLIMQDFGKQGGRSDWWPQKIYDIMDHRLIAGKTTILTSNYDLTSKKIIIDRFGDNHGSAIYSRLNGICEIWDLAGPDRRMVG